MVLRQLPHVLTLLRLLTSPVLAWLLVLTRFREALVLVLIAGLTDWLDGFLARRLHAAAGMGVVLDPLADKTLLVTLFLSLGYVRQVPESLVYLVIGRDLIIVLGAVYLRTARKVQNFFPSELGKISTFFQIVLAIMVLLYAAFDSKVLLWLRMCALILSACFTIASGLDYVRKGLAMSRRAAIAG